ncbi:MAG: hypothetical protein JXR77_14595 [Lentisphaeria bacterium]|nr:hypothetical protein [Lentisphaeria bacterium]
MNAALRGFRRRPGPWRLAALVLALGWCWRVPAQGEAEAPGLEDQAVVDVLHGAAQALIDRDSAAVAGFFVQNFAGPFRVPRVARTVLDQVLTAAQTVTAEVRPNEIRREGVRALVLADLSLRFTMAGGGVQEVLGEHLVWLTREPDGWRIAVAERLATDWSVAPGAMEICWPEHGVTFPVPRDWGAFPTSAPDLTRSVLFASPNLAGSLAVAVVAVPVPVSLKGIAARHRDIPRLYPGSRFLDEEETTLGGEPAILTRLHLAMGSRMIAMETVVAIRGNRLYAASRTATPAEAAAEFEAAFAEFRRGFVLAEIPAEPAGPGPGLTPGGYADMRHGVDFPIPEGWLLTALDKRTLRKRGWALGAHLRRAEGESYILLGARKLPRPIGLKELQEAEMKTIDAAVGEMGVTDEKDLTVSGFPARSWSYSLTLGQPRRRREVFVVRGNLLLFLIGEAIPPSEYDDVCATVDTLLATLRLADM